MCFDGLDGFVNIKFKHNNNDYLFLEFVSRKNRLFNAFKRVLKSKDENSGLKAVLCLVGDRFNSETRKDEKGEFKYARLPEKDRNLNFEKEDYPRIHIFTDGKYYDNTYSGKRMYNRLKKKLPIVCFEF